MNQMTHEDVAKLTSKFLAEHNNKDHVILLGEACPVMLSAPHGVDQWRNGARKARERGTVNTVLQLHKSCGIPAILKTKSNHDDANWDEVSEYKTALIKFIKDHNIKYVFDIHSLAPTRKCDINVGISGGKLISTNRQLYKDFVQNLCASGFNVYIDEPFDGSGRTISSSLKNYFGDNIWTIQVEINCRIVRYKEGYEKYKKLLDCLASFLVNIKE